MKDIRIKDLSMFTKKIDVLLLYKEYLMDIYKRDEIACDDKLAISPSCGYVNLAMVHKGQSTYFKTPFTQSTLHGGVDEVLATKTPLEIDALVTPGSHFVLIEGPPGIGKSTLCWELCRKWDTLKSLQDFKIVLLLKLRERRVQNATTLHELFFHEDKQLCEDVVKYVLRCSGEGVLLVMDGFDEIPTSVVEGESVLIMRLIKGQCLPRAVRLVTSRPSALQNKQCFSRHVEILGFTDRCKIEFAEKAFKAVPEIFVSFQNFIFSNPIITSLMNIPVNCAIVAQVYKELPVAMVPKTMTQLYTLLVLVLIRRHLIQTGRWKVESGIPDNLEGLPEDIKVDLMRVSELAYKGLMKEDVQVVFTDEDVGESFQHLGLMNEAKEMYVFKGAVTYHSFLHLSMQEYLAAWHVNFVRGVYASLNSILKYIYRCGILLNFLCGMCNKLPSFLIGITADTLHLLAFCYEARDVSYFTSKEHLYTRIDTPLDMYMFGYALVKAPTQWTIKANTSFGMLASSIADHALDRTILGSIVKLGVSTKNVTELGSLPQSLLNSINDLTLNAATAPALAFLPNVQEVSVHKLPLTPLAIKDIADLIVKIEVKHSINRASYFSYSRGLVSTSEYWNRVLWDSSATNRIVSHGSDRPLVTLKLCRSKTSLCKRRFLNFSVAGIVDQCILEWTTFKSRTLLLLSASSTRDVCGSPT